MRKYRAKRPGRIHPPHDPQADLLKALDQATWLDLCPAGASAPICARCMTRQAVTLHEIEPRSLRQDWYDPRNRIPLCHDCHRWVHKTGTQRVAIQLRLDLARYVRMLSPHEVPDDLADQEGQPDVEQHLREEQA